MKKAISSILLSGLILFQLTGCGSAYVSTVDDQKPNFDVSLFVEVEKASTWRIVYHHETKVMYAVSDDTYNHGTFTLLVDAEGKPLLWEE